MKRLLLITLCSISSGVIIQVHALPAFHDLNSIISDALVSPQGLTKTHLEEALDVLPFWEVATVYLQGDHVIPELLLKHVVMPFYTQETDQLKKKEAKQLWQQVAAKNLNEVTVNNLWNMYHMGPQLRSYLFGR